MFADESRKKKTQHATLEREGDSKATLDGAEDKAKTGDENVDNLDDSIDDTGKASPGDETIDIIQDENKKK